jgi:phage terminase small subunit
MLRRRQSDFVIEYLKDRNATQAAIRAGYSEKTAYSIGNENLSKPDIRDAIEKATEAKAKRNELSADRVIHGLLMEAENVAEGSSHSARVAAWAHLGKHLGMFIEKVEATTTMNVISEKPMGIEEWRTKFGVQVDFSDDEL